MRSHEITLWCGCQVYVACDPRTKVAHTRIIEKSGPACRERFHDVGVRLALWELLPPRERADRAMPPDARSAPRDPRPS